MSDTSNKQSSSHSLSRPIKARVPDRPRAAKSPTRSGDASSTSGALTPAFVLRAIRHWWKVALPLGATIAALAIAVVWHRFEPQFASQAVLQIREVEPIIVYQSKDTARRFGQTQLELIRSRRVLEQVVTQPDIHRFDEIRNQDDPTEWLQKNMLVEQIKNSELYTITLAGSNPEHAATIVNAIAREYFDMQSAEESRRTRQIIGLLGDEKRRRVIEVTRLRKNVHELTREITGTDPFSGAGDSIMAINSPLLALHQQLIDAEVVREVGEATATAYEASIQEGTIHVPSAMVRNAVELQEEVQRYRELLTYNEALLGQIAAAHVLGEKAPRYLRLANENQKTEKNLDQLREKLHKQFSEEIKLQQISARKDELAQLKADLSNDQFKVQLLQKRYDKMLADTTESSGQSLDLEFRRAELAREEKVLDLISSRIVRLLTESRAPARVTLLEQAKAAVIPIELVPAKLMGIAGLIGLLLPFGLAIFWEKIVCRVNDSKQLNLSDLEVVGEIATIPNRSRVWMLSGKSDRDLNTYEESVDSLRTSLILSEQGRDMQVMAVTSATSREGKTSLASQLAVSIARASGEPTLLIDGDMRSPDMHNVFEIDNDKGLAQVLAGECEADEVIVTNWSSYLHLLPAGQLKTSPHRLLGQGAFDSVLSELRDSYRYIVIDTPPVLSASEALVLSKSADTILLSTMREVSRLEQVTAAYDRLTASGARPIGTVLNGVRASRYTYKYGSYAYQRS